jgi:hypothetical protein
VKTVRSLTTGCYARPLAMSSVVTLVQNFTAAQAALQQMNLQLAAAVAERNMAEPKSRLAAEEARVHAENAVVTCCHELHAIAHLHMGLCSRCCSFG